MNNAELIEFNDQFLQFLDNHTLQKTQHITANNSSFMTKLKGKKITRRFKLRNNSLKNRTQGSKRAYNKQRNFCLTFCGKQKKLVCKSRY